MTTETIAASFVPKGMNEGMNTSFQHESHSNGKSFGQILSETQHSVDMADIKTESVSATSLTPSGVMSVQNQTGSADQSIRAMSSTEFQDSLPKASPVTEKILSNFMKLDSEAQHLHQQARDAAMKKDMQPADMMMLMANAQSFQFQAHMMANSANSVAQGLQQLFRQQS